MSDQEERTAPPGEPGEHRDDVPGEKTPGGKLVQFSSGLSKPFIQRPVMTMLLTASLIVFGILTFKFGLLRYRLTSGRSGSATVKSV